MSEKTTPYYLVLLFRGENYTQLGRFADAHVAFITDLIREDRVFIGGDIFPLGSYPALLPDAPVGAYLLKVGSREDAEATANRDPMIVNRIWTPVFLQWDLVGMEDN